MKTKRNTELLETGQVSSEFAFKYRLDIMLVGEGEVCLERKVGHQWGVVTYEDGEPMVWTAVKDGEEPGVAFNSFITANGPSLPHRIRVVQGEFEAICKEFK